MNYYDGFLNLFAQYAEQCSNYENIILYGWNWQNGGTYFEWLMGRYFKIYMTYIIDDNEISYGKKIYRHNLLEYLNKEKTIIFFVNGDAGAFERIEKYGYTVGNNLFNVCSDVGVKSIGFYDWLERFKELDLIDRKTKIDIKNLCSDGSAYAVSRGAGISLLGEYLAENFSKKSKILDIGCGKGAAMIMLHEYGFINVDGLEYLKELCDIANSNFNLMNIDCNVFNCDAITFPKYADYDIFYMYDPFRGETFRETIAHIVEAVCDAGDAALLVYANPWENNIVNEFKQTKLIKQIDGDWFTRMTNVYMINNIM